MKTPPFPGDASASRTSASRANTEFGSDRLDSLVADTVSNLRRFAKLDVSSVSAAELAAELRDNLYPSLLTVAEELRALDDDVGELSAPEPSLAPADVLAIARALRSAQTLAASIRQTIPSIKAGDVREMLREQARDVEASVSLAAAVVHRLVVVESVESVESGDEMLPSATLADLDAPTETEQP